ncbi:hypothetical protein [Psychrobacter lutiphocae]|uniref:hypothetical protein n=1 Tax=Psychrobacter lutiphocae TaxID=540500 RepID=UPI000370E09E|nr:hypothetical protein [Psychrobacter lutiphocae]
MKTLEGLTLKTLLINSMIVILIIGFMFTISNSPTPRPDGIETELEQKMPWLEQTSKDVAEFMDYEDANVFVSSRSHKFVSYYTSPEYSEDKLISLGHHLKSQGWEPISLQQFYDLQNQSVSFTTSQEVNEKTIILCKGNATVLIWVENLLGKYKHTENVATSIFIKYDYLSPCYGLET